MTNTKQAGNVILGLAETVCRDTIGSVLRHLPVDVYATDDGAEVLNRITTLRSVERDVDLLVLGLQLRTFSGAQILRMIGEAADVRETIVLATPSENDLLGRIDLGPGKRVLPLEQASVEQVIDSVAALLTCTQPKTRPDEKERVAEMEDDEVLAHVSEVCSTCGVEIVSGMGRFRTPFGTYCLNCHSAPLKSRLS